MTKRLDRQGGFTLLELLMVVIIIAILASIAIPQYLRVAERSRAAEALTNLAAIRSAELRYRAQVPTQDYTVTLTDLDTEITNPTEHWTFTVDGTTAGSNGVATRNAGPNAAATIEIDLDTGKTCTSNTTAYGLTATPC